MKWFRKSSTEAPSTEHLYAATVLASARLLSRLRGSSGDEQSLLDRECRRAQELGHPLTLLQLELADWPSIVAAIGAERSVQTQEELELVLRGTLRATDVLFWDEINPSSFMILLPGTQSADLPTVYHNLRQAIQGYRILAPDGAPFFLRLYPWIASASLPDDGFISEELTTILESRLREERKKPLPPIPDEDDRPSLRLVA